MTALQPLTLRFCLLPVTCLILLDRSHPKQQVTGAQACLRAGTHRAEKVTLSTVGPVVSTVKSASWAAPTSPEAATAITWNL